MFISGVEAWLLKQHNVEHKGTGNMQLHESVSRKSFGGYFKLFSSR